MVRSSATLSYMRGPCHMAGRRKYLETITFDPCSLLQSRCLASRIATYMATPLVTLAHNCAPMVGEAACAGGVGRPGVPESPGNFQGRSRVGTVSL